MRCKIHEDRHLFARHIIETHNGQVAIAGFWLQFCVAVPVKALKLNRSCTEPGRSKVSIRLDHRGNDRVFHLFVVAERRIESALALAELVDKLQYRAVVSM